MEPVGTSIAKAHHSSTNPPAIIAPAIENIAPKNKGAIVDLLISLLSQQQHYKLNSYEPWMILKSVIAAPVVKMESK